MSGIGPESFGQPMDEHTLKKGLSELCPELIFDPAGRLNYYHPQIGNRQGVWHNNRHICSMERGGDIPEYNVWAMFKGRKTHIIRVGWRHTLEAIARKVPGVTWDKMGPKFNIDRKIFTGDVSEIEVY